MQVIKLVLFVCNLQRDVKDLAKNGTSVKFNTKKGKLCLSLMTFTNYVNFTHIWQELDLVIT